MSVTLVSGVLAGHATNTVAQTGVTSLLFPGGARAAGFVPGSAPGTRDFLVLEPRHLSPSIHGICLSGGSAFGLAAADGVMAFLAERGEGYPTSNGPIPIVPAAILYDLHTATARPTASDGRSAAEAASARALASGRVGAGTGARVGFASGTSSPGGFGTWAEAGTFTVGACAAVNAFGSVWDPWKSSWRAGGPPQTHAGSLGENTTLAVVATDAALERGQLQVLARMASAGLARTLVPAFSPFDGDVVFAVSTGKGPGVSAATLAGLGHRAAEALARSVLAAF